MPSSPPLKSLREAAPVPRAAEREKAGHIKSMPVRGCIPILLVKRRRDAASNRESARRLFSMRHLKEIRALAPLSTSGASPSLSPKNGTHPQSGCGCAYLCWTNRDLSWLHQARAGRAVECKSRRKTDCARKRPKTTSCRAMYLCCDGPLSPRRKNKMPTKIRSEICSRFVLVRGDRHGPGQAGCSSPGYLRRNLQLDGRSIQTFRPVGV